MKQYKCAVNPADTLAVYVSDEEQTKAVLAMVMENKLGQKISVILTHNQAIALGNQVQDFINRGHQ